MATHIKIMVTITLLVFYVFQFFRRNWSCWARATMRAGFVLGTTKERFSNLEYDCSEQINVRIFESCVSGRVCAPLLPGD